MRDEPQRGLNVEVAAFEVIKRKRSTVRPPGCNSSEQ
jgi:hypothetical protein